MAETPAESRTGSWSQSVVAQALAKAWYVIFIAALVAGVYGFAVSSVQPKTYTATSQLVLSADSNFSPLGASSFSDASRFISNQKSIMLSDGVLQQAVKTLDNGTTVAQLTSSTTVEASDTDNVLSITSTASTAAAAAARADAIANGYSTYNAAQVAAAAAAAQAATTDVQVINTIKVNAATYGDGVAVVEPATVPTSASSPQPLRNALLLFVATAIVASIVVLLRRGRVASSGQLSELAGSQLLGTVPVGPAPRDGRIEAPEPADYALSLVALDYALDDCPVVVLVTGASRASGTPSAVLGLAAAAAQGRRVVVVEADLDGAELLDRCGAPLPKRPLSELSAATSSVGGSTGASVRPTPLLRDFVSRAPGVEGESRAGFDVAVLFGGADAGGVLENAAFAALRGDYDLVLVNAGPVATDPIAFALLREVNGALAVVSTTEDANLLTDVRAQLAIAHKPLTGVLASQRVHGARRRAWGRAVPAAVPTSHRPSPTGERTPASA